MRLLDCCFNIDSVIRDKLIAAKNQIKKQNESKTIPFLIQLTIDDHLEIMHLIL